MLVNPAIIGIVVFKLLLNQLVCSNFGLKASCQSRAPQALGAVNGVGGGGVDRLGKVPQALGGMTSAGKW